MLVRKKVNVTLRREYPTQLYVLTLLVDLIGDGESKLR
jgi:hypothetical protein